MIDEGQSDCAQEAYRETAAPELPMRKILERIDYERVIIESVGSGWVVTHERTHCTLGTKAEREVFLNPHDMAMWVLEHLTSYEPGKKENQKSR